MRSLSFLVSLSLWAAGTVSGLGTQCRAPLTPSALPSDPYWLQNIPHLGSAPHADNAATYEVFRNVMTYGAKGDGVTDDTAAINAAISDGTRCAGGCTEYTTTPAVIYFPSGTYVISAPIVALFYSVLVGDKKNLPVIKATSNFNGIAIFDADVYTAYGEYYGDTNNFYRIIRNFVVDMTDIPASRQQYGIHWQVAQATSLQNIVVNMSEDPGTQHWGIFMENGSGGFVSDLIFNGGYNGVWLGNQQFTFRNLTVNNAQNCVFANWNWGFSFQDLTLNNCSQTAFYINTGGPQQNPPGTTVGGEIIIDAQVSNSPIFIKTSTAERTFLSGSIVIENIVLNNVPIAVIDGDGTTLLEGTNGTTVIDQWVQGNVYKGTNPTGVYEQQSLTKPKKPANLLKNGKVLGRPRNQYDNYAPSQFVNVKSYGAKGDGVTDDSAALQAVIDKYWGCKIIYIDAGNYILQDTLYIPAGTFVVGEVWPVLTGSGPKFQNKLLPRPVVQVGLPGQTAPTEISEVLFSTTSGSSGAIVLEWNVGESSQASAAMWDSHFRLGGYIGSGMQDSNCLAGTFNYAECTAAYLSLWVTPLASAYFENIWVWVADHDLDGSSQTSIFAARGVLIEALGPVWLLGTASEHHTIYNYNFVGVQSLYMSIIQVETPYYQPLPAVPAPFFLNPLIGDPTFPKGVNSSWGLHISNSHNVFGYGVNLYSFFQNYTSDCLTPTNCQSGIFEVDSASTNINIFNLNTVGVSNMVYVDNKPVVPEAPNNDGFSDVVAIWQSSH